LKDYPHNFHSNVLAWETPNRNGETSESFDYTKLLEYNYPTHEITGEGQQGLLFDPHSQQQQSRVHQSHDEYIQPWQTPTSSFHSFDRGPSREEDTHGRGRLIWGDLAEEAKKAVLKSVFQQRHLQPRQSKREIKNKLTSSIYQALISGSSEASHWAMEELFPLLNNDPSLPSDDTAAVGKQHHTSASIEYTKWNSLLPDEVADRLVARVMHATGQSDAVVRHHFTQSRLDPHFALFDLLVASDDKILQYARKSGLEVKQSHTRKKKDLSAWEEDLSPDSRERVLLIVERHFHVDHTTAEQMLERSHIYDGFGRMLFASKGEERKSLLYFLDTGISLN
jgi:hypothetical protein